ncbi:MAG: hypothetical protein ACI89U_002865 [Gammaproteobacteria bacterium]|jgi:uncharacterized protein YcaQ
MTVAKPLISNEQARRIFMARQGLCNAPTAPQTKADLRSLIHQLGFVQLDSIRTVERAHHMILFARNHNYQPEHLRQLHEEDRHVFEHWTHDAAVIPTEFYPHWRRRFDFAEKRLRKRWRDSRPTALEKDVEVSFEDMTVKVLAHVKKNGPTMSRDFKANSSEPKASKNGWWEWHPSKTALEFLWRMGDLSVTRRDGFQKVYDISSRVIPADTRKKKIQSLSSFVHWSCNTALDRLGFSSPTELSAYWGSIKSAEAKAWCEGEKGKSLVEVLVENADGSTSQAFARQALLEEMLTLPEAPDRLRVLSPFDPVIRDRKRLLRLFGFDYRIEIFFPEAKRQYGYYVFPLMEKDRLIGRIDMKADRTENALHVKGLWLEQGVTYSKRRQAKLQAELNRHAKFVGVRHVTFEENYLR